MKSEQEMKRAVKLFTLYLSGQVKLPNEMNQEAKLNAQGVVIALDWVTGQSDPGPMDRFLAQIEQIANSPGFSEHQAIIE